MTLGFGFLRIAATILLFNTATARYVVDFLPWCLWLALIGWALLEREFQLRKAERSGWVLKYGVGALALFSCLTAFCANAELHDILASDDPSSFTCLSRFFDYPVWVFEHFHPAQTGPIDDDGLSLCRINLSGSVEPLVVTGAEYQKDYLFVFYETSTLVRFCYARSGRASVRSEPMAIVPGRPYRVTYEAGSLYPPAGFPGFSTWDPAEIDSIKAWAIVAVDGKTVLVERQ